MTWFHEDSKVSVVYQPVDHLVGGEDVVYQSVGHLVGDEDSKVSAVYQSVGHLVGPGKAF